MAEIQPVGYDATTGQRRRIRTSDTLTGQNGITIQELTNSPAQATVPLTGTVSIDVTNLTGTVDVDVATLTGTVTVGRTPLTGTVSTGLVSLTGTVTYGVDTTPAGTVSVTAGMTNVIGVGTAFTTDFVVGEFIEIGGEILEVSRLNSDTDLDLSTAHIAGAAGSAYTRRFDTTAIVGTGTAFTTELSGGDLIEINGLFRTIDMITDNTNLTVTTTIDGEDSASSIAPVLRQASTAVVGTGTLFTTELTAGQTIRIEEEEIVISSITDNTNLILQSAHAATAENAAPLLIEASATVLGTGTAFTTEVAVGDFLEIGASTITVSSIASNTELTLSSVHPQNSAGITATRYDNNVIGTGTLFTTETAVGEVIRLGSTIHTITAINSNTDLEIATPTTVAISGASAVASSLTVTGVGTLFTTELSPGDTISIAGEGLTIDSIASNTSLTVLAPHSVGASGVAATTFASSNTRGTLWTRNDSPNILVFTNNQGTDFDVAGVARTSFNTINADSGSVVASTLEDTLTVTGTDGIATSVSGSTLTITSTITTLFNLIGRLRTSITTITGTSFTVLDSDSTVTILADATSNNITINLPNASSNTGRVLIVKVIQDGGNTVSVVPPGSETIDTDFTNGSPFTITTRNDSITVQSDGSNWWIV